MTLAARIVVPCLSHYTTQRRNRREPIFFGDGDHEVYASLPSRMTCNDPCTSLALDCVASSKAPGARTWPRVVP
jgi:hypothetical protein